MKERPIIFSGPMVMAILDGRKIQTRRSVKPQPPAAVTSCGVLVNSANNEAEYLWMKGDGVDDESVGDWFRCPYGNPGDALLVKETHFHYGLWQPNGTTKAGKPAWKFVQHTSMGVMFPDEPPPRICTKKTQHGWFKRSPLFMTEWDFRIRLDVKAVRLERLQAISRGDAMAEGCPFPNMARGLDPRQWYRELWDSINGPGSWAVNPWVWVVDFERTRQ